MAKVLGHISGTLNAMPSYSMTVTHASYENYKTPVPYERSAGYFRKDRSSYHSFLLGIHTIENQRYRISVDSSAKVMMVADKPDNNEPVSVYGLQDYKDAMESCTVIKVISIGTDKLYRLEYKSGYPLSAHELLVSDDGLLKKITWYYAQEVQKDPEDKNSPKDKPRLEISFSSYKKNPVFPKKEFDESSYFSKKDNRIIPAEEYRNYQVSDQRLSLK